ncbi:MAG: hypothetical protein [Caudoviricetes sp.]|nr:MAG: hypothetical protein [Caudoviricetes sp.]
MRSSSTSASPCSRSSYASRGVRLLFARHACAACTRLVSSLRSRLLSITRTPPLFLHDPRHHARSRQRWRAAQSPHPAQSCPYGPRPQLSRNATGRPEERYLRLPCG